jgi:hypothetical protein
MADQKTLYVVHCIDTEGPLNESITDTFARLNSIFNIRIEPTVSNLRLLQERKIPLNGQEEAAATCFAPKLLDYNKDWNSISSMLDEILSKKFREKYSDDFNGSWIYSWHCVDHMGFDSNPRHKDYGYGKIFRYYKEKLKQSKSTQDELNWHFHPLSLLRNPLACATSYTNNYSQLNHILCRRIIEDHWFPTVNRPGFNAERPDSHAFLEQWIPFDYANQSGFESDGQLDLADGRYGDWRRAPKTWRGYNPSHDDYQSEGTCRRKIFRCLNIGTRTRHINKTHVTEAFAEANTYGSAILAFANHDYRDVRNDIAEIYGMIGKVRSEFQDVRIKFAGAEQAAMLIANSDDNLKPRLRLDIHDLTLKVEVTEGEIFGPQPFLAIETASGDFYHDNFDVAVPKRVFTYTFDESTIPLDMIKTIGVASAGKYGRFALEIMNNTERQKLN